MSFKALFRRNKKPQFEEVLLPPGSDHHRHPSQSSQSSTQKKRLAHSTSMPNLRPVTVIPDQRACVSNDMPQGPFAQPTHRHNYSHRMEHAPSLDSTSSTVDSDDYDDSHYQPHGHPRTGDYEQFPQYEHYQSYDPVPQTRRHVATRDYSGSTTTHNHASQPPHHHSSTLAFDWAYNLSEEEKRRMSKMYEDALSVVEYYSADS